MKYIYLGDRITDPRWKGAECDPVLRADGKCITGRGAMLVRFKDGYPRVVIRRLLRKIPRTREEHEKTTTRRSAIPTIAISSAERDGLSGEVARHLSESRREGFAVTEFNEAAPPDTNDRQPEQDPGTALAAKTRHLLDVYEALGVAWGADPFTAIRRLKNRAAAMPAPNLYESIPLFGYELVARERIRQITQEGWTEEHDDEHRDGSLAIVGAMYAVAGLNSIEVMKKLEGNRPLLLDAWPDTWSSEYDKRNEHPRLRQLAIAGALICAEIDRLQRLADQNERAEAARIRATLATDAAGDL